MSTQGILYNIQRMSVHDGPGIRTTVFFKGCPLRCLWCSNPESQALHPQLMLFANLCIGCGRCAEVCPSGAVVREGVIFSRDFSSCSNCGSCAEICPAAAGAMSGRIYEADEVMKIVRKDAAFYFQSDGGVTFSGGECTLQGEFLIKLITRCSAEGIHTCVDTCGQTEAKLFLRLIDMADLFLFDVKHMDCDQHKLLTGVSNNLILQNLAALLERAPGKARIRMPLMPGMNDCEQNIAALAAFLKPYGVHQVDVLPCHSFGRNKYHALKLEQPSIPEYEPEELKRVIAIFAAHGLETEIV